MIGSEDGDNAVNIAFRLIGVVTGVISGGLVIGGLVQRQRSLITGSRLILAGSTMTLFGGLELIPVGMIVLISGFWTGNLQLSEREDQPDLHPIRQQQVDMTSRWYLWLVTAAVLFAVGFGALIVLGDGQTSTGEDDNSLIGGLSWLTWILSWLGAMVMGGIGVILGGLRLRVRHRTRLA